jgi:glycogen debranching enzyme
MAVPHQQKSDGRDEQGRRRVVQHGRASTTASIAHAVVIKQDELFFLCDSRGDVPMHGAHGLGLYYHDCRYLDGYELRLGDVAADPLAATAASGSWATFELTNPDLQAGDRVLLEKECLAIKWERTLDVRACALHDSIAFSNFSVDRITVPVSIRLRSRFDSLFTVRGARPKQRGTLQEPQWDNATLLCAYDGADHVRRTLSVTFSPAPDHQGGSAAEFQLAIEPHATTTISMSLRIRESTAGAATPPWDGGVPDVTALRRSLQGGMDDWLAQTTRVQSNSRVLERVLGRSVRDLHVLRTSLDGRRYFSAGVPWYVTLFGRDSIISAIEALAFMPDCAADTIRLLASYQGTRDDPQRDEAPGKIMHELRVGEMAHLGEIPQTPYYGSVDATPLFLILLARHAAWSGSLDLFNEVKPCAEAALNWIDKTMADADGYLTYAPASSKGLANHGWKDSGDAIVNRDGTLAQPPIALIEVQGYVYMAKQQLAELYRRAGEPVIADRLMHQAEDLRRNVERDFWHDDLGTYALALQTGGRPALVVTSNPGQALWTGIVSGDRAKRTAARLMQDDMFSGWGVRTLSTQERRYNPIGYHVGTVWPHDNAIAVAGFRRYGCLEETVKVMTAMIDAASGFDHDRLPEVFAGFSREDFPVPVHYPVACHPQAWAAGAVPYMIESALGLSPDAFNHRLHVSSPVLPDHVDTLTLERLRVGGATARIVFARERNGAIAVQDVHVDGHLDVTID